MSNSKIKGINTISLLLMLITIANTIIFPISKIIVFSLSVGFIFMTIINVDLKILFNNKKYRLLLLFLLCTIAGLIRGLFAANSIMDYELMVAGTSAMLVPTVVLSFSNVNVIQCIFRKWFKYAIIVFLLFIVWNTPKGAFAFFWAPLLFLGIFAVKLPNNWKFFIIFTTLVMCTDLGSRAMLLKAIFALFMMVICKFNKFIGLRVYKLMFVVLILAPVIFLWLGLTGKFNVFKDTSSSYEGKYVGTQTENDGTVHDADLASDTRTFIYYEVINSAINNNYIIFGRSLSRGNDTNKFGTKMDCNGQLYGERYANEVNFPNIFTWLGLVGMILNCTIFIHASYRAINKSNSHYMKLVGLFVAFHFFLGWMDDISGVTITYITIWMAISMCYSDKFIQMNDIEFKRWLQGIFKNLRLIPRAS